MAERRYNHDGMCDRLCIAEWSAAAEMPDANGEQINTLVPSSGDFPLRFDSLSNFHSHLKKKNCYSVLAAGKCQTVYLKV